MMTLCFMVVLVDCVAVGIGGLILAHFVIFGGLGSRFLGFLCFVDFDLFFQFAWPPPDYSKKIQ